jgi:hypothetical protein
MASPTGTTQVDCGLEIGGLLRGGVKFECLYFTENRA